MSPLWGRREFLGLVAASALAGKARAAVTPRLAAIDWAMLETAVALGVMPVAATELIQFRVDAVEPEIPATVADLGLRDGERMREDWFPVLWTRPEPAERSVS